MQKNDERTNLSDVKIYDLLKVKNPRKFHLTESRKKIITSIELLTASRRDLLSTPFSKNKRANKAITDAISRDIDSAIWHLLSVGEAIGKLDSIKQNGGPLTDIALKSLLDELEEPII
ncbi:MAG TPA: hypothetical protein DHV28_17680 [Ignavibacteriales bacterium]|nr:hypothetical protein [Ignavibacteriales bacterium]